MKHTFTLNVFIVLALLSSGCLADPTGFNQAPRGGLEQGPVIVPVDEAFRFGSYEEDLGIKVFWQVMPGYFLYRDKFELLLDGEPREIQLPGGVVYHDEIFGEVMVLEGLVELPIAAAPGQEVVVRYQGCAAQGYCYPPQKKTLNSDKSQVNSAKSSKL